MSFPPSPSPPNGRSLWFITESEITKSGWDINVSLELCSVLWQYLTHYGLQPCVVKNMEPISELLFPGWRALIHTMVPVLWILLGNIQWRRMWLYQWPLLPEYPEFTGDFEVRCTSNSNSGINPSWIYLFIHCSDVIFLLCKMVTILSWRKVWSKWASTRKMLTIW